MLYHASVLHSFLLPDNIPLFGYTTFYCSIQHLMDNWFDFLAILNNVAKNISMQVFIWTYVIIFLIIYIRVDLHHFYLALFGHLLPYYILYIHLFFFLPAFFPLEYKLPKGTIFIFFVQYLEQCLTHSIIACNKYIVCCMNERMLKLLGQTEAKKPINANTVS